MSNFWKSARRWLPGVIISLVAIAAILYFVDLKRSFVVGDHPHDVQLAMNSGSRGIYVLTGHGSKHMTELPEDTEVADGIAQAAEKIISYYGQKKGVDK